MVIPRGGPDLPVSNIAMEMHGAPEEMIYNWRVSSAEGAKELCAYIFDIFPIKWAAKERLRASQPCD